MCVAAAAKLLQSCPTLCDPTDGSPPGSVIPGILQARTLEWVSISFSNAWKRKVKMKLLSHVRLLATPWTPASMGFSRQEYWSGLPLPSPCMCVSSPNRETKPISIKNDLYQARKTQIFIKYPPLKMYLLILHVTKIGSTYKTFLLHTKSIMVILRKSSSVIVCVVNWTSCFYHKIPFLCKRTTVKVIIQIWLLGRHFHKNEQSKSVTSRKTTDSICWQSKWWNLRFK